MIKLIMEALVSGRAFLRRLFALLAFLAAVAPSDEQGAVAWHVGRARCESLAARVQRRDGVEAPAPCCVTLTQQRAKVAGLQASRAMTERRE